MCVSMAFICMHKQESLTWSSGGFAPCWHLQNLSAESNLLVSCTGLQGLPYLQTLSCARNHLPVPPDVSHSSLLTMLHLQQNNLQEVCSFAYMQSLFNIITKCL